MTREAPAESYDPNAIIDKWMKVWDDLHVNEADGLTEGDETTPRSYVVSMYPYPSGDLHMGHAEVYSISDAIARYVRMQGHNVLNAIGWDSFGLPAENAALKRDLDPRDWTYANIAVQAESFRRLGVSFDWRTRLHTSDPEYYRWNQWLFLRLFDRGLAYRKEAAVNWCPNDRTVLANEQVIAGRCERCGTIVVQRPLTQWFFKTTAYAQRFLDDMAQLEGKWPHEVLAIQRNWIGRSVGRAHRLRDHRPSRAGARVHHPAGHAVRRHVLRGRGRLAAGRRALHAMSSAPRSRRTSRPPRPRRRSSGSRPTGRRPACSSAATRSTRSTASRSRSTRPTTCWPTTAPARSWPYRRMTSATWTSRAPTACPSGWSSRPASRTRPSPGSRPTATVAWSTRANSTACRSRRPRRRSPPSSPPRAWARPRSPTGSATGCSPGSATGVRRSRSSTARSCGLVPVPDEQLPVELPTTGYELRPADGESPLSSATDWVNVECPACGGPARRDTDTMDTFVDSSWYFLRYPNPDYADGPFDPAGVARWLPVDEYIGGREHATGHLMYSRFITKVLYDLGMVPFVEPFTKLMNQGQVIMAGKAMSKTLGNLVNLQEQIAAYGPDAVRVTMVFAGPPEDDIDWADVSPTGAMKWLARVWRLTGDIAVLPAPSEPDLALRRSIHKLVAEATTAMDTRRLNVGISRLMELTNVLRRAVDTGAGPDHPTVREGAEALVRMLSCFAPFTAEEGWERLGHEPSIASAGWPQADPTLLVEDTVTCILQVDGKLRDRVDVPADSADDALTAIALASERVQTALAGATVGRVIVRAPKLVNVVTVSLTQATSPHLGSPRKTKHRVR